MWEFARGLATSELTQQLAQDSGLEVEEVRLSLTTAAHEAAHTLEFVGPLLQPGMRVLEVGSGLGLLGGFLWSRGVDIHLLEPGGTGFERYLGLFNGMMRRLGVQAERRLEFGIEDLRPELHGSFDLIFSNNVLEHVASPEDCLIRLSGCLRAGGSMVHSCPNYLVPFEPHYGIPLLPIRPAATARLLPGSIISGGCWRSLNFITTRRVRQAARMAGCGVRFRGGELGAAFRRLAEDREFEARHTLLAALYRKLSPLGIFRMADLLPAWAATPMLFEWVKPSTPTA